MIQKFNSFTNTNTSRNMSTWFMFILRDKLKIMCKPIPRIPAWLNVLDDKIFTHIKLFVELENIQNRYLLTLMIDALIELESFLKSY